MPVISSYLGHTGMGTGASSAPDCVALQGRPVKGTSLAGLELGDRLGTKVGERGELIGGLVLIAVGIAIASGIL